MPGGSPPGTHSTRACPRRRAAQGNNPILPRKRFYVLAFTGQDICLAVRDQAPFELLPGGDCGSAFLQLQPVMPQTAMDVRAGETFFVLDVSGGSPPSPPRARHCPLAAAVG